MNPPYCSRASGTDSVWVVIAIWDGADNQTLYEILYMVHILSIVAAFGPLVPLPPDEAGR